MEEKKEVLIAVSDVRPGMTVSRDVYTRNDQLLVSKGSIIDENGIARITFFGILSIYVFDKDDLIEETEQTMAPTSVNRDLSAREFSKRHQKSVVFLSEKMNQLIKSGEEINEKELIQEVGDVLERTSNRYQVFDMLGYIQRYDDETYLHSLNVGLICNVFGDWLGMSVYEKNVLTLCGLLHDIGKLLINKDILRKPGQLTKEEYEVIKEHPLRGYKFLKNKKIHESVKMAVLSHHERCNGNGYPYGVHANEIDPYAAITAVADVFEAMTSNRVYRKALCPFKVVRIFQEDGRKDFNPIFLIPILRKLTEAYLQHNVLLSDGRKGKIILINDQELSRPSVICDGGLVDLTKFRNLEIVKILD